MNYKRINIEKLNEELYVYEHSSGLKAYVIPKPGYHKKYATFATHYGSIDNQFIRPGEREVTSVPDGIAHFLEHKLFEQKDGSVMDKFSALGSSPNAYTAFNQTVYLFSCTERFQDNFKLLLNFVQNPYITEDSVEKEKGIIGQEIQMYQDNPDWRVFFNLLAALFEKHPVRIDIAGTRDSIAKINKDTLYTCYNTFYHPSNMMLLVVGDVVPGEVFDMVEESIQKNENLGEIKRVFPNESKSIYEETIEQKLAVSIPMFQMGFKDTSGLTGYSLVKRSVAIQIIQSILMGKSSCLYNELYEEGLINRTFGVDCTLEPNYGFSVMGGQSPEPFKVKERIMNSINKTLDKGLDKDAFERIRKASEGSAIRKLNSIEAISHEFISVYFKGVNFFDLYKIYSELQYNDVEEILRDHFSGRPALSIVSGA